jgi:superfamily II DNA or RNA helicase
MDRADLNLLPQQLDALRLCDEYLSKEHKRSALIHMPTGTGKTGIMAVLGAEYSLGAPILVVCPSDALATQLCREFHTDFWVTCAAPAGWAPDNVERLFPSTARDIGEKIAGRTDSQRIIVVSTIAALQQLHGEEAYEVFVGQFSCVLFDEGHREPALKWAAAVRGLSAPTILFSATPFRNDIKLFDVGDDIHFLSFENAVDRHLIRGVSVEEDDMPNDAHGFADWVISKFDEVHERGKVEEFAKVIIRTNSEEDVLEIATALRKSLGDRGEGILAVHHQLKAETVGSDSFSPSVPERLEERPETFLVHQFMLTEGLDDRKCQMLIMHSPFTNERQLVQQIGRCIRHPSPGSQASNSLVFGRRGDGVADMWSRFIAFDRACVENGNRPILRNDEGIFQSLLGAMPEMDYVNGRFRQRVNIGEIELETELRLPCSAVLFTVPDAFDDAGFAQEVVDLLANEDRWIASKVLIEDGRGMAIVTMRIAQSPFLVETLFQSASLEVTVFVRLGRWMFFYDSAGLWIDGTSNLMTRISPQRIAALLPEAEGNVVTALNLKNTDIGPVSLRSRSLSARSLATAGVFMGENANVVTRAVGRRGERRSSIGLTRGRVREKDGQYVSVADYLEWANDIASVLNASQPASDIFDRFAMPVAPPSNPIAKSILVDLEDFDGEFVNDKSEKTNFDLDSVCVNVSQKPNGPAGFAHAFDLTVDGARITVWLRWDSAKGKFWIRSNDLAEHKLSDNPKISLTKRLNQRQPFRIFVEEENYHYSYGHFYQTALNLHPESTAGKTLLGLITGVPGLDGCSSEKGTPTGSQKSWPRNSLFHYIDTNLARSRRTAFGEKYRTVVCEDLGNEMADFIGIDDPDEDNPRVSLYQAKWKDGAPGVSASLIYDVCAQGAKNLSYLKADASTLAGAAGKWDKDWTMNEARINRLRSGSSDKQARRDFASVRSNPRGRRRLSLVLGGGILSKRVLEDELAQETVKPHVLQFYYLLMSVFSSCQSVGVELEVLCAE